MLRRVWKDTRALAAATFGATMLGAGACNGPVAVDEEPAAWQAVATTRASTCGIRTDGRLICWTLTGADGLDERVRLPDVRFTMLNVGADGGCALATDGRAFCWTDAEPTATRAIAPGSTFRRIAGSGAAGCGTTTQGDTRCWTNGSAPAALVGDPGLVTLSVGGSHACGLTAAGAAYCWGTNAAGELGLGSRSPARSDGALPVGTSERFVEIHAAPTSYTCARTAAGQVVCWGLNLGFELGVSREARAGCESVRSRAGGDVPSGLCATPQPTTPMLRVAQLVVTPAGACGLDADGVAHCWGVQMVGVLGSAPAPYAHCDVGGQYECTPTPVAITGVPRLAQLGPSLGFHRCATTPQGEAYCWGNVASDGTPGRRSWSEAGQRVPVRLREPRL